LQQQASFKNHDKDIAVVMAAAQIQHQIILHQIPFLFQKDLDYWHFQWKNCHPQR
jgi:hypothetical protein